MGANSSLVVFLNGIEKAKNMKKTAIKLIKGDWLVHAQHGIGEVMDFCSRNIGGEETTCLEIKTTDLTYWLPINDASAHHIRHVSTPGNFKVALTAISATPEPISDDFRVRNSYISAEIANGTLSSKALLIRDMNCRQVRKGYDVNENSTLKRLKLQFVDEMMMACKLNRPSAQAKLDTALQKSSDSQKPEKMSKI
jgi:CarD family transcriptional regulator